MSHVLSDSFSSEVNCSFPGHFGLGLNGLSSLRLLSVPLVRNLVPPYTSRLFSYNVMSALDSDVTCLVSMNRG
jgi:hypothetical protein